MAKKFGIVRERSELVFEHEDVFELQETAGPRCLCIGPSQNHIGVLLSLIRESKGPYCVLYVLHTPRGGHAPARYESPPLTEDGLERFLNTFRDYLQNDGRHDIWVHSFADDSILVYDRHNVLYAYGPLEAYAEVLRGLQFREGRVEIPLPHTHHYNKEYDVEEKRILGYFAWKEYPLQESDRQ